MSFYCAMALPLLSHMIHTKHGNTSNAFVDGASQATSEYGPPNKQFGMHCTLAPFVALCTPLDLKVSRHIVLFTRLYHSKFGFSSFKCAMSFRFMRGWTRGGAFPRPQNHDGRALVSEFSHDMATHARSFLVLAPLWVFHLESSVRTFAIVVVATGQAVLLPLLPPN